MNKSKGFVITSDAFLGITLLFFLILISLNYVSNIQSNAWNNIDLINSARDVSIVFEKNNYFQNAIKENTSELLSNQLLATQSNICFEINLFENNSLEIPKVGVLKAGCNKNFDELIVVNRTFVVNDSYPKYYLARVEAWYK